MPRSLALGSPVGRELGSSACGHGSAQREPIDEDFQSGALLQELCELGILSPLREERLLQLLR